VWAPVWTNVLSLFNRQSPGRCLLCWVGLMALSEIWVETSSVVMRFSACGVAFAFGTGDIVADVVSGPDIDDRYADKE